jgi:hypothetical protein
MTIEYKDSKRIVGLSDGVSNGYDVANISYSGKSSSSSSQNTYMLGIGFNEDGTKMYRTGYSPTKAIFQYTLSTAWDISTSSYDNVSFSLPNPIAVPYGIEWNGDGTKFVIGDNSTGDLFQFTLSTAYDISTTNSTPTTYDPSETSKPVAFKFFNNGLNAFLVSQNTDYVYKYTLSTAYDISTMSYATNSLSYTGSYYISGMEINSDGTELYLMDHIGNSLRRYTLSTAYDLSTASLTSSFSTSSQFSANTASALRFSADGTKLYISGYGASDFQYDTGSTASDRTLLTNVQDNSLFVEKDTARRYWLTPQTVDTEEAFSFTTTDTVNALWGNRIYGMKLLSGHSGLNKYIKKIKTYHPTNPTGSRLTTGTLYHVILDSSGTEIARSAGVSASSISNNSWAETTLSTPVKLEENYTVGLTISTGDANTYLGTAINNNSSSPTNTTRYYKDEFGTESTATTETILMVFDSDPATGLSIPSTWTKQLKTPTNEDLEDQTWTKSTSDLTQGDSYIQWANMTGGTENGYYDLGSGNISDTKWVLRAKLIVSSYSTGGAAQSRWCGFGLSSSSSTFTGTQDSINIILRTNSSSDTIAATRSNGTDVSGQLGTAGISGVTLGNGTFYLELIRESDSDYKLYVRSGSHTGTLLGTGEYTNASGVSGLRYIKTDRLYQSSASGDFVVKWEDIDFWNEVTEA